MVHHFTHRDDTLYAEDVNLNDLAAKVGTPFYVYSSATLRRHVRVVKAAFEGIPTLLAYAIYRLDPVFILGQSAGVFIYARNLYFIRAGQRPT